MFGINLNLFPSHKSITSVTFGPGSIVEVETLVYGKQLAVIEAIALSPFCGEESIYRARVGSLPGTPFFLDYLLVEDLVPAEPDFELELENDPDYIAFLDQLAAADYAEAIAG